MAKTNNGPLSGHARLLRKSILTRLLATSVAIAVGAIATTAWVISNTTRTEIESEHQASLEADSAVYKGLLTYGNERVDWSGVDTMVREMAQQYGRRIAITSLDNSLIADSSANTEPLPKVPSAKVDVAAPISTFSAENANKSDTVVVDSSVPPMVLFTPELEAHRMATIGLAEKATTAVECLKSKGVTASTVGNGLELIKVRPAAELEAAVVDQCLPVELRVPPVVVLWLGVGDSDMGRSLFGGNPKSLLGLGMIGALVVLVTYWSGRRLILPLRELTTAAAQMTAGEREVNVEEGDDEIGRLARTFNKMVQVVDRSEKQQRMLVADIAHEVRSPLTTMRGNIEAIQEGVFAADKATIDLLGDEVNHLMHVVSDLEDLALADSGRLRMHPELVDVSAIASDVASGRTGMATHAGIVLHVEALPVVAHVDPVRLRQIIGNLLDNAIAHTPTGGEVVVGAEGQDDGFVIWVKDTGVGIAPDDVDRIFDRLFRADVSRSRRTGGAGLGLAITKSLVEAHGGNIKVESRPGKTLFTVFVPA